MKIAKTAMSIRVLVMFSIVSIMLSGCNGISSTKESNNKEYIPGVVNRINIVEWKDAISSMTDAMVRSNSFKNTDDHISVYIGKIKNTSEAAIGTSMLEKHLLDRLDRMDDITLISEESNADLFVDGEISELGFIDSDTVKYTVILYAKNNDGIVWSGQRNLLQKRIEFNIPKTKVNP